MHLRNFYLACLIVFVVAVITKYDGSVAMEFMGLRVVLNGAPAWCQIDQHLPQAQLKQSDQQLAKYGILQAHK